VKCECVVLKYDLWLRLTHVCDASKIKNVIGQQVEKSKSKHLWPSDFFFVAILEWGFGNSYWGDMIESSNSGGHYFWIYE